ncbi:MAG: hypothetical protein SV422_12340, partial [Pseudomonadota bacterium]|nr:hypothetical protein [Pseudomonadota bacterium]
MKLSPLLSAGRAFALATVCATASLSAYGAALFTLKGEAFDVRNPDQSEVRLSLLGFTPQEKLESIEAEFRKYATSQDHEAFNVFLQQQDTQGYLFTKAATGHTIKYAWQQDNADGARMVLLVTPALKSRTPYMWKTPNDDPAPFSLVELRMDGEQAVMKTSLETDIETSADGRLQLQDFNNTSEFARLTDAT